MLEISDDFFYSVLAMSGLFLMVVVDITTLKMARKLVKIQRKVQQDALGKVNKIKEISRRE